MKGIIYKFNKDSSFTEEQAKQTSYYRLMEKIESGEKVDISELSSFNELGHPEAYRYGILKWMGWLFDFRPYMKRFLVNEKYYGWREIRSFSKTTVRKLSSTPSYIQEIVEIQEPRRKAA